MAKASDNPFPSVLVVPGAAPASPASGQRLYLDSADGNKLKRKDSAGTVVTIESAGGSPGRVLLDTQTLAAAAASITFGSSVVPTSGYKHLEIELLGRTSQAAASTGLRVQLNGDTTAGNYASQRMLSEGSSMFATTTTGTQVGYIAGDSATAGVAGTAKLLIPDFLGTTWRKTVRTESFTPGDMCIWGLSWANTAAITQVVLLPDSGNFKIGTVARLYGLV